jgi:ribosomal protein L37AE/L43A
LAKRRRRLEIKVQPLPEMFMQRQAAACPVCGREASAIGRLAMQVAFRCDRCKVVFKRVNVSPLDRV